MKLVIGVLLSLGVLVAGDSSVLALQREYRERIRELEPEGSSIALSDALNGLAALYFQEGDFQRAQKLSERALEVEVESEAPRELEIGRRMGNIGSALAGQGKWQIAIPLVRKAMGTFEKLGAFYEEAFALNTLGTIELHRKNTKAALQYFESAVKLWQDYPPDRVRGMANVATALNALARPDAMDMWVRTLAGAGHEDISDHERGVMMCGYADALARAGKKAESAEQRRRGHELMRGVVGATVDRTDFR